MADPSLPGGDSTSALVNGTDVYSQASGGLTSSQKSDFQIGNGFFRKRWVPAPASTQASDGLGPLFNATSCQSCHIKDGRGNPPLTEQNNSPNNTGFVVRLSDESNVEVLHQQAAKLVKRNAGDPNYGSQLQDQSTSNVKHEGFILVTYNERDVPLADGGRVTLQQPSYKVVDLGFGPLFKRVRLLPRVAPPMIGLGLLEAIDEDAILALSDPEDSDSDGISGKPNWGLSLLDRQPYIGRFGWKANAPTITDQVASAFAADLGLSTPLLRVPHGDCTSSQSNCLRAATGESGQNPEVSKEIMDLVAFYSSNLAVPKRRDFANTEAGEQLFTDIGCAACHRPSWTTSAHTIPALRAQVIYPYTDLLLHDMGEGLADIGSEGLVNRREWRTQPLWGIGLAKQVNANVGFLHDGRARNVSEAILWHAGEGAKSQAQFIALSEKKRTLLLKFVNSL